MKFIKKIASVLTATILFVVSMVSGLSLTVGAKTTGTYESLTYVAYDDYVEITGCEKTAAEVTIPSEINGLPVTNISRLAFFGCNILESVTIPKSVTIIDSNPFYNCLKMKEIIVLPNNSNYCSIDGDLYNKNATTLICFSNKEITSFKVPESVTSIGDEAFRISDKLVSVTLPKGLKSIEKGSFSDCSNLTSINFPESLTSIGDLAFSYCSNLTKVTIPKNVTSIGASTFYECKNLTELIIPNSVTSIGSQAFAYTPWLEAKQMENPLNIINNILIDGSTCTGDVVIPEGVTSILGTAFDGCVNLTSVKIPNSVTSIGNLAFGDCSSLTKVTIPNGVTNIGESAFAGCSNLIKIEIPESVTSIGINAFSDTLWLNNKLAAKQLVIINKLLIDGTACFGEVVIPEGVTTIQKYAFEYNKNITSITIPSTLKTIETGAFIECYSLSNVYYTGTNETWNLINIGELNSALVNTKLNFIKPSYIAGDVDGNGKLNLQDAVDISLYNMNMITFTEEQIEIADYTGDGKVGLIDVVGVATAILPSNK